MIFLSHTQVLHSLLRVTVQITSAVLAHRMKCGHLVRCAVTRDSCPSWKLVETSVSSAQVRVRAIGYKLMTFLL